MPFDAVTACTMVVSFLRRADQILETSAAQREDLATAGSTMQILVRVNQHQHRIERRHLPVDQLLAAASQIRPVVMEKESVFLGKVITAVSSLVQTAPDPIREHLKMVRRTWKKVLEGERWIVMAMKPGDPEQTRLTDVEIAELFFNAYVWHDDQDKQWALRHISQDEQLICATVWVSDRVLIVRAIQQLIVDLRRAGHIPATV